VILLHGIADNRQLATPRSYCGTASPSGFRIFGVRAPVAANSSLKESRKLMMSVAGWNLLVDEHASRLYGIGQSLGAAVLV
jgi:hypothetical protein